MSAQWGRAGRRPAQGLAAAPEDTTMAGFVVGTIARHLDTSLDVTPDVCPVEDPHAMGIPRCYTIMFDGEHRACPYLVACTHASNTSHRADVRSIAHALEVRSAQNMRIGVLCMRQRANRPVGC